MEENKELLKYDVPDLKRGIILEIDPLTLAAY